MDIKKGLELLKKGIENIVVCPNCTSCAFAAQGLLDIIEDMEEEIKSKG